MDVKLKLESLEQEFYEYKLQSDELEQCLEQEIADKDAAIAEYAARQDQLLEELQSLREKYTRNEREVVALQNKLESTTKELKFLHQQNRELELVNDQCEQSLRALEFYKQDLEERLYQAQESVILYKEEVDQLQVNKAEEVQRLKEQNNELQQEIQILKVPTTQRKDNDLASTETSFHQPTSSLKVIARVRPIFKGETPGQVTVGPKSICIKGKQNKEFQFLKVLNTQTTQSDVFSEISEGLDSMTRGGRACVLAYGQTGSGKTYTMKGVISGCIEYLSREGISDLSISCIEIYNEMVRDLLSNSKSNKNWKEALQSAEMHLFEDWPRQLPGLIDRAAESRSTKFTQSNEHSSRSHFVITITARFAGCLGQIQLVDLAGSERISASQVKGDALKETLNINKSLSALQDVIVALDNKQKHIPYRNSVLTQILQPTLGGTESHVTVILNCSLAEKNLPETACTLALGERLKAIDLSFHLKNSLKNQESERMSALLEKERAEKCSLLRKLEKVERDNDSYSHAIKDKENKIANANNNAAKKEKEYREEIGRVRKELAIVKEKFEDCSKKLKVAKTVSNVRPAKAPKKSHRKVNRNTTHVIFHSHAAPSKLPKLFK